MHALLHENPEDETLASEIKESALNAAVELVELFNVHTAIITGRDVKDGNTAALQPTVAVLQPLTEEDRL